jgi:hypothetical protein
MNLNEKPLPMNLDEKCVASLLNVTVYCLRKWRWLKQGPTYIKFGANVRYPSDLLHAWIEEHIVRTEGGK